MFSMPNNDRDRLHVTTFIFAINLMKHTGTIFICFENPFINEAYQQNNWDYSIDMIIIYLVNPSHLHFFKHIKP